MTNSTGQRRYHNKNVVPNDPNLKRWSDWTEPNRGFVNDFRRWLIGGGYHGSTLNAYGVAVRIVIGLLDKPYWALDIDQDLHRVREYIQSRSLRPQTRRLYRNGIDKVAQYLCHRLNKRLPERSINWEYYVGWLPEELGRDVRSFVVHKSLRYRSTDQHRMRRTIASRLSTTLRWLYQASPVSSAADITPQRWFALSEQLLSQGKNPVTLNTMLSNLLAFLHFLSDAGRPICRRMLAVQPLDKPQHVPKDLAIDHLRQLWQSIELETQSGSANLRRLGRMDRAWYLLMVHGGLRSGEVRRLLLADIDWQNRRVRIEQSKGLKDRLIPLSSGAIEALKDYLLIRGPVEYLPEQVFIHKHRPLGPRYCAVRLRKYGQRIGLKATPHQLRHSCATLLLNSGAPVLTVQTILGHKHVDTTMGYARLFDGTLAADYYRAMSCVESQFSGITYTDTLIDFGYLVALVDSLRNGTLNEKQAELVHLLRSKLLALAAST